jgi:uncharacterized protein YndB with AHSA1/START domain
MPIKDVIKDPEACTLTVTADLAATLERSWQLWADPRQFERWWGSAEYPTTVVDLELVPGGRITFFMTGPDGEKFHSVWGVVATDPPRRIEMKDADVDGDGTPNDGADITAMVVTFAEGGKGTIMTIVWSFLSPEGMERAIEMGMDEGMQHAMRQIDVLLAGS